MKFWTAIKKWFRESLEAMEEGSVASSMWVDGYSDFEIEAEIAQIKREHEYAKSKRENN